MNILMFLSPKSEVRYLTDTQTLRQGLETMRIYGYSTLPVISRDGTYIGSVSEGDFLWYIMDTRFQSKNELIKELENKRIKDIIRPELAPALKIDADMETIIEKAMCQNYIPLTDDKSSFIGIVTRQNVIRMLSEKSGGAND